MGPRLFDDDAGDDDEEEEEVDHDDDDDDDDDEEEDEEDDDDDDGESPFVWGPGASCFALEGRLIGRWAPSRENMRSTSSGKSLFVRRYRPVDLQKWKMLSPQGFAMF